MQPFFVHFFAKQSVREILCLQTLILKPEDSEMKFLLNVGMDILLRVLANILNMQTSLF